MAGTISSVFTLEDKNGNAVIIVTIGDEGIIVSHPDNPVVLRACYDPDTARKLAWILETAADVRERKS
jgi:hypothetical protein